MAIGRNRFRPTNSEQVMTLRDIPLDGVVPVVYACFHDEDGPGRPSVASFAGFSCGRRRLPVLSIPLQPLGPPPRASCPESCVRVPSVYFVSVQLEVVDAVGRRDQNVVKINEWTRV
ncbi:hypothetical protein AAG570_007305 [Ranatra chinensis]|uniref:Uncharacterized protein n=1 Tax=Ranatra chinensis TaxID=642074 RepID=A0ABD0YH96_9HEMI